MDRIATYTVEWTVLDFFDGLKEGFNGQYQLYYLAIKIKKNEWEVLYIGQVTKQTVSDRLLGGHDAFKTVIHDFDEEIFIGLGRVSKRSLKDDELSNIELALISCHKPRLNGVGVKMYRGDTIRIINTIPDDAESGHDLDDEIILS